jgi:hypothetical protein
MRVFMASAMLALVPVALAGVSVRASSSGNVSISATTPNVGIHHNLNNVTSYDVSQTVINRNPRGGVTVISPGFVITTPGVAHGVCHVHNRYCRWIEGHYEYYTRQIWVPAHYEDRYVPPVYQTQIVNGVAIQVLVSPARYERIWVPAHYETITEPYWVPGYWTCGYQ